MKILILSTAFSGLTQRVVTELQALNHSIEQHYDLDPEYLITQVDTFQPDVIVCPFLTQRIPPEVWQNTLCLVVHPGIEGDRGPSSLDWAISEGATEWGVTLLQADAEYDAGDIWGTRRFPMRPVSKTSIYKREVSENAVKLIKEALLNIERGNFTPRSLDYDLPHVKGYDRPMMSQDQRFIDWYKMSTETIVNKLRAADSRPGVRAKINGHTVHMYGGVPEPQLRGEPGEILAIYKEAFCCATRDGAVWIKQLKCTGMDGLPAIKLPATMVLEKICGPEQLLLIRPLDNAEVIEEIRIDYIGDTAYVYFNFYNGAMSTRQCRELRHHMAALKQTDIKTIVLMGGEDFWSNGIHLNCIEANRDPGQESWNNINAINDLMYEIISSPKQMTVAALRNNAGAGGVIMALACDQVVIRSGVVLNPHYKSMGLFGSEYWTYLLPRRVGIDKAREITDACLPMLADEAFVIGLADQLFDEDWRYYDSRLKDFCSQLSASADFEAMVTAKKIRLARDEARKPLSEYRKSELAIMKKIFFDPNSEYHRRRKAFVYKQKSPQKRQAFPAARQA